MQGGHSKFNVKFQYIRTFFSFQVHHMPYGKKFLREKNKIKFTRKNGFI